MQIYNLMSCKGFVEESIQTTIDMSGPCAGAKLMLVVLFFINALVRKWGGEEMGLDYNFWAGLGGALVGYIIIVTLTGNIGLSFVVGIVAMLVAGYGGSYIFGGGSDDY